MRQESTVIFMGFGNHLKDFDHKMKKLLTIIKNLKKSEEKNLVDARIKEFKEIGKKLSNEIFKELCFCILTANFNAERSIKIQNEICNGFSILNESQLTKKLKELGHRYPSARAKYIFGVRKYKDSLKNIIKSFNTEDELREWLVKNVKGLGYKEASHFLRNVGLGFDFAILDRHIMKNLLKYEIIKEIPKCLTKNCYLSLEKKMKEFSKKVNIPLAELDLLFWSEETGEIFK